MKRKCEIKTLYLAHNFLTRKTLRKWELKIEGKYNVNLDNPFYDNPDRASEMETLDNLKEGGRKQRDYLSSRSSYDIVEDDLKKIRQSDGIVAFAHDVRIGTPMEIFYAARVLRIPVYVITKKWAGHPWIKQHARIVFTSRKTLEKYFAKHYGLKK